MVDLPANFLYEAEANGELLKGVVDIDSLRFLATGERRDGFDEMHAAGIRKAEFFCKPDGRYYMAIKEKPYSIDPEARHGYAYKTEELFNRNYDTLEYQERPYVDKNGHTKRVNIGRGKKDAWNLLLHTGLRSLNRKADSVSITKVYSPKDGATYQQLCNDLGLGYEHDVEYEDVDIMHKKRMLIVHIHPEHVTRL